MKMEWLEVSGRRPDPAAGPVRNKVKLSVKGPLYAASAVFERRLSKDGRWTIAASADASIPLKKKWHETVAAAGEFSTAPMFMSHREQISGQTREFVWRQEDHSVILDGGSERAGVVIDVDGVPVCSSADLLFLLHDVWMPSTKARGLFTVAAKKLYALRLQSDSGSRIRGAIAALENPEEVSDWRLAFENSLQTKPYDFELGWSEEERLVTDLAVKVPVLGRIRVRPEWS